MTQRYLEYKSSGVEWIGEIPIHWGIVKLGHHISILSGFPFKSELFDPTEGFPILRIRDITSGKCETFYKGEYTIEQIVSDDDLLVGMDGDFTVRWWEGGNVLLNQRCCRINPHSTLSKRFLYYTLPDYLKIVNDLTYYTTVKHLSNDDIRGVKITLPPLPEQEQIVKYLDEKTSQIDQLISITEKKIEGLKEKRTSLINHIVTKGLDSNVEMKDSGVEWIGKIPKHWIVGSFRFFVKLRHGFQFRDGDFTDEGIKIVKITQLHRDGYLDISSCSYVDSNRLNEFQDILIKEDDILMCLTGGTIGKIIRVGQVEEPLFQNYRVGHFSSKVNHLSDNYLFYLMSSNVISGQIFFDVRETGQPNIGLEDFNKMKVCIPSLNEQEQIVEHLVNQTKKIDEIISIERKRIETLKEYRQSLISEVVTGKVRVCEESSILME